MIKIDSDVLKNRGIDLLDFTFLFLSQGGILNDTMIKDSLNKLMDNDLICCSGVIPKSYGIMRNGTELLETIITDCDKVGDNKNEELLNLAKELKSIFPKGKKDGTPYYWSDGAQIIVRRLKLFFRKYGNTYSNEDIKKAAENYVKSFNGDYRFMRLLKYFIFKEEKNSNGEVEGTSDLINFVENKNEENSINNGLFNELR